VGLTAVEHYDEGVSEDSRRVDIDGLEEARCAALVQSARYLEGIRRYHDRNIKEHSFNVGDLVLHRIQNTEGLHKLSSPWEGPFTVAKVTGPGSYCLQTLEGEDVNNSWNVDPLVCGAQLWESEYLDCCHTMEVFHEVCCCSCHHGKGCSWFGTSLEESKEIQSKIYHSVRWQWDPGIITATAWGQAVFRGVGNVMT
jgi:hypothetical protein